jgi:four helix bundle protein
MRASTSAGANYQEACGAESKADFIHKMQIVLKELKECLYWIKLTKRAELIDENEVKILLNESEELVKIIAKSVITAKS